MNPQHLRFGKRKNSYVINKTGRAIEANKRNNVNDSSPFFIIVVYRASNGIKKRVMFTKFILILTVNIQFLPWLYSLLQMNEWRSMQRK
jgi:hypothetical protein